MGKKRLMVLGLIVLAIFVIDLALYFNKGPTAATISGLFITDLPKLPFGLNFSILAFIGQWALLLFIIIFAYTKFLKHKREEESLVKAQNIVITGGKSETPLDSFYTLIKEKESLPLDVIAKVFKISKEKALEWAKILEEDDLVSIEYPAFNDPEIMIKGFEKKDKKEKNIEAKKKK